jgi:LmbE family N-acetylglucosaminyl deacetylase
VRVLAIAAHPDDETLGCGGSLLKHRAQGDELFWIVVTQAHEPQWSREVIDRKAREVQAVAQAYGMQEVHKLAVPTVTLDTMPQAELIDKLRQAIDQVRPNVVYLVHPGDVHTDHHAVFTATLSVLKAFYMRKWDVKRILCFETLSSTEAAPPQPARAFIPNVYQDISPHLDRKVEIMNLFASEAQKDPLPRGPSAMRALARYRGATIGTEYAEAFMLIREIS